MTHLKDPARLWLRHACALVLILAALAISHVLSRYAISGGVEDAKAINISGLQRTLSQQIVLYVGEERATGEGDARVDAAISRFEKAHDALLNGGALGLSDEGAHRRRTIMQKPTQGESLDAVVSRFIKQARRARMDGPAGDQAWQAIKSSGPGVVLDRLDRAVSEFERQASSRVRSIRRISDSSFYGALVLIVLEALFIVMPAQGAVNRAFTDLARSNARLRAAEAGTAKALRANEAARAELQQAVDVKTGFLANMSHELRTPLNEISGMLQILEGSNILPEYRTYVNFALDSTQRLLAQINGILDLSEFHSGRALIRLQDFSLEDVIADVISSKKESASSKGLGLSYSIGANVPKGINSDPDRIGQVLEHLLNNAIKFTDIGEISVSATFHAGKLKIAVSDTGVGICPGERENIFHTFEQADSSSSKAYAGLGVGLAICRHIADAMGGAIDCVSEPGRGSSFWFEVPVREADPVGDGGSPQTDNVCLSRPLRVLLVEDNRVNQKITTMLLERLGHRVEVVSDGSLALDTLASGPFDLVLMDVQMPGTDGVEATKAIRTSEKPCAATPIIALTANSDSDTIMRCLEAGVDGYLSKPINIASLSNAISAVIGNDRGVWPAPPVEACENDALQGIARAHAAG